MIWFVVGLLAIGGIALLHAGPSFGAIMNTDNGTDSSSTPLTLDEIFQKWGADRGVDWRYLKAIAMKESSLNPNAVNSADNESLGLMQILCRPDGNGGCSNTFHVDGWDEATREKLLDPDFNVRIGSAIFAWNVSQFGLPKAIAVYNKWNERTSPQEGPFENQSYVNKVLSNFRSLA